MMRKTLFICTEFIIFLLIIYCICGRKCNVVKPSCSVTEKVCEFSLVLNAHMTMSVMTDAPDIRDAHFIPVEYTENGTFAPRKACTSMEFDEAFMRKATESVPTGDGAYKVSLLFNNTLPGPALVVYKGQQVVVRVKNKLKNDAISVHWHGIHQRHTPWMDGVAGLSQCAINPGETFTYRFMADTAGTYWYHTHSGTQRTMGAYGPLIVLEHSAQQENENRRSDPLPEFEVDYYLVVSDWFHNTSLEVLQLVINEAFGYFYGYNVSSIDCFNSTKQADGLDSGVVPWVSGLMNGKGWRYDRSNDKIRGPKIPLETFKVTKGSKYRFRLISASMTFYLRVSIDHHKLNVISTDGSDVVTKEVESIILASGERYDFWIDADNDIDNYWIRAETIETIQNGQRIKPGHVNAILRYEGAPNVEPKSTRTCYSEHPCEILNCPYKLNTLHSPFKNSVCVSITKLQRPQQISTFTSNDIKEHLLNFHFASTDDVWKSTVNGIINILPPSPLQIYPEDGREGKTPCTPENCRGDLCLCTHVIEIPLGKVVQLVFAITVNNPYGVLNGNSHPVHLHGQHLQVLKIAYPVYDKRTNFFKRHNRDIKCFDQSCNNITWSNSAWKNGHADGLLKVGAPLKDTIIIPVGGYVVTRFKADNPGYWFMHCHTEFHNEEGMSVILKVGNTSDMNETPKNTHRCGDFDAVDSNEDDVWRKVEKADSGFNETISSQAETLCEQASFRYELMTVILGCCTTVLFSLLVVQMCKFYQNRSKGYTFIPSTE